MLEYQSRQIDGPEKMASRGRGGIGRRARLRIWCPSGVGVQVSSPAPCPQGSCGSDSVVECDLAKVEVAGSNPVFRSTGVSEQGTPRPSAYGLCGCSSTVEPQPSKLVAWVRFPSPAPFKNGRYGDIQTMGKRRSCWDRTRACCRQWRMKASEMA